jgi:hypothetical protein
MAFPNRQLKIKFHTKLVMIMELEYKNTTHKSRMFPYSNIYKITWTSPDRKPTIRLTIFW